ERREDAAARERDDLLLERAAGRAVAGERDRVAVVRGPPVRPVVPGLGEDRRLAGGNAGSPAGATGGDIAAEGGLAAVGGVAVAVGEAGRAGGRPADAARADARGVGEAAGGAVGRGGRRAAVHRVTDADRAGIGGVAGRRAAGGADAALAGLVTVADVAVGARGAVRQRHHPARAGRRIAHAGHVAGVGRRAAGGVARAGADVGLLELDVRVAVELLRIAGAHVVVAVGRHRHGRLRIDHHRHRRVVNRWAVVFPGGHAVAVLVRGLALDPEDDGEDLARDDRRVALEVDAL